MGVFAVDLSVFPKETLERLHKIWTDENAMEMVNAKIRQEKIARFYQDNAPRWKDGFGPMVMAVDPYWRDYFRTKYGEDADSPEFQDWVLKQEGMFGVKAVAPKPKVGYRGGANPRGEGKGLRGKGTGAARGVIKEARVGNVRERIRYGAG